MLSKFPKTFHAEKCDRHSIHCSGFDQTAVRPSSLTKDGEFKDTVLSNANPAPASITPPELWRCEKSDNSPDAVNMRSQADYHFTLGESLSFDGQFEKAIEEFKLTLIYDPSAVSVRLRLAAEYVRAGEVAEAVEQAELVVQSNPDNDESRMFLGGLYTGMKMYDAGDGAIPRRTQAFAGQFGSCHLFGCYSS